MKKKVFIKTFGCQMNEYDSNRIYDSISKIGYHKSEDQNNVDCYILNTCHIRDKAKEKVFHEIGRIKKIYNIPKYYSILVKPNFGCSTKEIYSKLRKFDKAKLNKGNKKMFDLSFLRNMKNSLEPVTFSKYPRLKKIKLYLENSFDPIFVRMTGSGSALVAYFHTKERCEHAKKRFIQKYKNMWCITSKTI